MTTAIPGFAPPPRQPGESVDRYLTRIDIHELERIQFVARMLGITLRYAAERYVQVSEP